MFVKLNEVSTSSRHLARDPMPGTGTITQPNSQTGASQAPDLQTSEPKPSRRHPLFGLFKDTLWIDPTLDLTEPAYEDGEGWLDEKAKSIAEGMR